MKFKKGDKVRVIALFGAPEAVRVFVGEEGVVSGLLHGERYGVGGGL